MIEARPHRKKRGMDANRACWFICTEIAKKTGIDKEEVYRINIRQGNEFTELVMREDAVEAFKRYWNPGDKIGWFVDIVDYAGPGMVQVYAYHGSSEYDSKQMYDLIQRLLQDAENVGLHIDLDKRRIDSLIADWEAKHEKRTARKR